MQHHKLTASPRLSSPSPLLSSPAPLPAPLLSPLLSSPLLSSPLLSSPLLSSPLLSSLSSPPPPSPSPAFYLSVTFFLFFCGFTFTPDLTPGRRPQTADRRPQTADRRPHCAKCPGYGFGVSGDYDMLKVQLLSVVSSIWISNVKVLYGWPYANLSPQTTQETKFKPNQSSESLTAFRPKLDQNSDQIETDADPTHQSQTKLRPIRPPQSLKNRAWARFRQNPNLNLDHSETLRLIQAKFRPNSTPRRPRPQTADRRRPQTADRRPQTADRRPQTPDPRPQTPDPDPRPQTPDLAASAYLLSASGG